MSQRNEVLRQHQWPALLPVALWTAGGMSWQKATSKSFFGSSSRISENFKKTTLKQKKNPTKHGKNRQRRWKKISEKHLLSCQGDPSLRVCLSSGLLILDNEAEISYCTSLNYTYPPLEYFKEHLFVGRPLSTTYPFSPLEKLCKTFSIKAEHFWLFCFSSHDVPKTNSKHHSIEIWSFLMFMKYSTLFSIQVGHHSFIFSVVVLLQKVKINFLSLISNFLWSWPPVRIEGSSWNEPMFLTSLWLK